MSGTLELNNQHSVKNLLFILFLFVINANAQTKEEFLAVESNYKKFNIGDSVKVNMQIRDFGDFDCAASFDAGRKFDPKTDFAFIGVITEKLIPYDDNRFVKIKIEKMLLKNQIVESMVILLEKMYTGKDYIFNFWRLEIEKYTTANTDKRTKWNCKRTTHCSIWKSN